MALQDRISNLPHYLIHAIMECLPIRDAARMSILSHKWRDNWRELPTLVLDGKFITDVLGSKQHHTLEFNFIVSTILLQHNGPINKFTLHISSLVKPDVAPWISFLSTNHVKEITLINWNDNSVLKLPSHHLFCCANLTRLKIHNCTFQLRSFEGFQNLINIDFVNVLFPTNDFLEKFVAKCPLLENLSLRNGIADELPHLVINAPNLKYLTISGIFQSINLHGCHDLLSVSFTLRNSIPNVSKERVQEMIEWLASSKVEELCIKKFFIQLLADGGISEILPLAFTQVRTLRIAGLFFSKDLYCTTWLLQSCPNVERLHLSLIDLKLELLKTYDVECIFNSAVSCKYLQLRNISVKIKRGSFTELNLVKLLLICSPVLETFNLEICEVIDADDKLNISRKLNQFQKASCNIFFVISMTGGVKDSNSDSNSSDSAGANYVESESVFNLSDSDHFESESDSDASDSD